MNVLGTWTSKGLPRPSWSNARGDVRMTSVFNSKFWRYFSLIFGWGVGGGGGGGGGGSRVFAHL